MQVKSIAECSREHSAILLTFIKLSCIIKIFVLSIFEWLFYTGFTVQRFFFYLQDVLELHYDYSQLKQAVVSHKLDLNTGHRNTATVIYDYKNVSVLRAS